MRKLFLKFSGIAVLILILNLNPLINILLTKHIEFDVQDENQVVSSITGISTQAFSLKNSFKKLNANFCPVNKSVYNVCNLTQNIIFRTEMTLNFRSLPIKFPRWSKSTFT